MFQIWSGYRILLVPITIGEKVNKLLAIIDIEYDLKSKFPIRKIIDTPIEFNKTGPKKRAKTVNFFKDSFSFVISV